MKKETSYCDRCGKRAEGAEGWLLVDTLYGVDVESCYDLCPKCQKQFSRFFVGLATKAV